MTNTTPEKGLIRCADGSWESDSDKWKEFPCWTCAKFYKEYEDMIKCKKSHPSDMKQVFMSPMGLDGLEPITINDQTGHNQ